MIDEETEGARSVPAVAKNEAAPFYSFSKISAIFDPIILIFSQPYPE